MLKLGSKFIYLVFSVMSGNLLLKLSFRNWKGRGNLVGQDSVL